MIVVGCHQWAVLAPESFECANDGGRSSREHLGVEVKQSFGAGLVPDLDSDDERYRPEKERQASHGEQNVDKGIEHSSLSLFGLQCP